MNQTQALKILKSGANVFLTGEPGSGKTYLINQYVEYLNSHGIKTAITASTGIAATHIGGMTIHSWSGIGIKSRLNIGELHKIASNSYVSKRIKPAKVLIIDEISMLPPETLQTIDQICREVKKNSMPFGGIQVVLVGDFFQLPPVTKRVVLDDFSQESLFEEVPLGRFAYDSPLWRQADFVTCYITEQHRQDDDKFVRLLSKIRSNSFDETSLNCIKERQVDGVSIPSSVPKLFSHNVDVDTVNDRMLSKIPGEAQYFPMLTKGHEALIGVMKKGCLSPENLFLKVGASVMFTKNSPKDGYVNGTLGVIESFDKETEMPVVEIRNGRKIKVSYAEWILEEDGKVKGRLSQIPLRLAWAITVHKSQGISLDEAVIDLSRVFEFGQGYVAISRVKRLSGVYILGWNDKAFQVDPEILEKDKEFSTHSADAEKLFANFSEEEFQKMHGDFITLSTL
ncbi:TPA: AAA family ATPase [Candidatus Berkelbacteria bacterium]|uniref:ATPase AAA n=1 Tax=Berkelbacteria bacterium GW2011_GWE1_39_12 TaxID=1618337 RepID=A0A0G4B4I3_9BACT|nr:MAG: ATPase AAA [Berkelbacteria bacterium GW2011_GWE1_39_12]HBO60194.1 AAA family ATPase [Candidatus Berkelbacteria bacterium]